MLVFSNSIIHFILPSLLPLNPPSLYIATTLLSAIFLPKLSSTILVVFKDDYFRIQIFLPGKYHLEPQMFISLPLYRQVLHVRTPLTAIFLKLYSSISVVFKDDCLCATSYLPRQLIPRVPDRIQPPFILPIVISHNPTMSTPYLPDSSFYPHPIPFM